MTAAGRAPSWPAVPSCRHAKAGDNACEVTIKDARGKPVTDADVSIALYMPPIPAMKMPEMCNSVPLSIKQGVSTRGPVKVMMAG